MIPPDSDTVIIVGLFCLVLNLKLLASVLQMSESLIIHGEEPRLSEMLFL